MSRWRFWRLASVLLAALAPAVALAASPGPAVASAAPLGAREALVLAASIDGRANDEPVRVERLGREAWMRADDLRRLGVAVSGDGSVALSTIPGVRFAIDDAEQTIALATQRAAQLSMTPVAQGYGDLSASSWGAVVNYDATVRAGTGGASAAGAVEAVGFTPDGYAYAGAVGTAAAHRRTSVRRTEVGYSIAAPGRLMSATFGDFINAASGVSRPVRLGGVRVGTDFALRPDLITFPLPSVSASAAVPTAVDVIVNGARQAVGDVREGRFAVSDIPVQAGVNTVSVQVRDALGRPTLQTVSTYTSRALLRPGLSAWSGEAGWLRTGYLTDLDRYRRFALSGTARTGLSGRLTVEGHMETAAHLFAGGVGGSLGLGRLGLLDVAASLSTGSERPDGHQYAIGFERLARPVTFSARYTHNDANWSDLASRYGSPTRSHTLVLNLGFDLARYGTLSAGLLGLGRARADYDLRGRRLASPVVGSASTLVNATYSVRIVDRIGLVANVAVDTRRRRSGYASLGALLVFGRRSSGFVGVTRQDGRVAALANVSTSAVEQGQWGYRAAVATGAVSRAGAAIGYLGHAGYVEGVADVVDGRGSAQLSARGSVGLANRHLFAADTMTGSFAVIDTRGQAHVPIYQDNRRIGTTDARGYLVAPNLAAYEPTKFSIDPETIDASLRIGRTEAFVRPARRAGVRVSFDLAAETRRLFTIVGDDGVPLGAGAHAEVAGERLPIGHGGILFAPVGARPTSVRVGLADGGGCVVELPGRDRAGTVAAASLRCRRTAAPPAAIATIP